MSESKKELEIRLVSVDIDSAAGLAKKTNNVISCRMPWLRTGIELRDGSQKINLVSGRWTGEGRQWHERILVKETVQGNFSIVMGVSYPVSDSAFEKILGNSAYYMAKTLATLVDKAAPSSALGDLASAPLESLAKSVTDTKAVKDAFAGAVAFTTAELPESGETFSVEIPLFAKSEIRRDVEKTNKGSTRTVRKILLKAGDRAGTCVVEITVL